MTREQMLAELAAINLELTKFARGGMARTKESEMRLSGLHARKAELESALPTAPTSAQASPEMRELVAVEAELGAVQHQMQALLSRPRRVTLSDEQAEADQVRTYSDRAAELNNRLATLKAAVSPPAPAQPVTGPVPPSAFPRATGGSASAVAAHLIQQVEGQAIPNLTTEAAVRSGEYGKHRAEVHRRLGLPAPDDKKNGALTGTPVYGRPGGNGLGSPAVQAFIVARGKRLW